MKQGLPEDFEQRMREEWPSGADQLLAELRDGESSTSVLLNRGKQISLPWSGAPVPWYDSSVQLLERPIFADDPYWHAGAYYVQEASSMFLAHALKQLQLPEFPRALDLCAAPGGKSLILQQELGSKLSLVSNEIHPGRNKILQENIQKWGHGTAIITQADASQFRSVGAEFDLVLVDAPCSGEGMFRKDLRAREEWSEGLVKKCADRQELILEDIVATVKSGGYLVYSTCTFAREENEDQLERLLKTGEWESVDLKTNPDWHIHESVSDSLIAYRFFPHRLACGEGLFMGVLKKKGSSEELPVPKRKGGTRLTMPTKAELEVASEFNDGSWESIIKHHQELFGLRNYQRPLLEQLMSGLKISVAGTNLGELKGRDFIPSHAQAMLIDTSLQLPKVELDRQQALEYLRRNPVEASLFKSTGFHLVCHSGAHLGLVKSMGNRVNNYYPKNWRLLRQ